ncbi:MAG: dihydrodipicolinate synthase family protein [Bryobacterales bacterium]|nr:dihydrodipicolinate synthase family protein [Bryobacterales bacterium]
MPSTIDRRQLLQLAATLTAAPAFSQAQSGDAASKAWQGIFVIMQTPFHEDLAIDEESLRKETDFLCRGGVHGVVWPAGAGESSSLSFNERMRFSPAVVKEAKGRTKVLIGVHGANKFEAMEYARFAEKIGADGLHALGPTDDFGDQKYMEDYFTSIASVSKLPMCIQVSNAGMTTDFLLRMAEKIPSVRILKLEMGNIPHEVERVLRERKRPDVYPSTGGGAMNLYTEMERGSGGTMAGAGFADIQSKIWDLFHQGNKKESFELFQRFLLSAVLERRTTFVLMKEVLRRRGIFKNVVMRRTSRFTMDAADLRELDEIMEILRPDFRA